MFVVMALIVTFITTPLTTFIYPKWYQTKVERWRRGEIDWDGKPLQQDTRTDSVAVAKDQLKSIPVQKLLVYLRLDGLSGICTLAALLGPSRLAQPPSPKIHPAKLQSTKPGAEAAEDPVTTTELEEKTALRVHGVRLMELTDRDSSVMTVSEIDEYTLWDPVINTFRAFGQWHDISIMAGVSVVPEYSYADTVVGMARDDAADLLMIPWSETGAMGERQSGIGVDETYRFANGPFTEFASNVLDRVTSNVGIFIERSVYTRSAKDRPQTKRSISAMSVRSSIWGSPAVARSHHIVFPFFGGDDDRFALRFVLQLAQNDQVTATIIHMDIPSSESSAATKSRVSVAVQSTEGNSGTASSIPDSDPQSSQPDSIFLATLRDSLPAGLEDRVVFHRVNLLDTTTDAVNLAVVKVKEEMDRTSHKAGNIVVVGRKNNKVDSETEVGGTDEVGGETRKVLGVIAEAMVRKESRVIGNVLVLQGGSRL